MGGEKKKNGRASWDTRGTHGVTFILSSLRVQQTVKDGMEGKENKKMVKRSIWEEMGQIGGERGNVKAEKCQAYGRPLPYVYCALMSNVSYPGGL